MSSEHQKTAYVLYNERPMSGLIKGQVIALLTEIKKLDPTQDMTVIALWQPWVVVKYRDDLQQMRAILEEVGIKLESWPFAFLPSRYFLYKTLPLRFLVIMMRPLFRAIRLGRFDLIHCRSYFASKMVSDLKPKDGWRLIFDMRSLLPEEYVTVGKWTLESDIYYLWKRYERETAMKSDAVIAVSPAMKDAVDEIDQSVCSTHIDLAADSRRLTFSETKRAEYRDENGWNDNLVIAYLGSLENNNHWNSVQNYAKYFARILKIIPKARLVFVVPKVAPDFEEVMLSYGAPLSSFRFVQGDKDLSNWLSAADIGVHVMSAGPDSPTRMGVKVVEYLTMGLGVITNSSVGAAADFVEWHNAGIRLDWEDTKFEDKLQAFCQNLPSREAVISLARIHFSLEKVGASYAELYQKLLARDN